MFARHLQFYHAAARGDAVLRVFQFLLLQTHILLHLLHLLHQLLLALLAVPLR